MSFGDVIRATAQALHLAERPPAPDLTVRGGDAVSYAPGGESVARLIDQEYRYELRGRQGGRTYQRMRWSDPHIWGLREAQNLPMLQARVSIEPADRDDKDALAKAALVQRLLIDDYPWRSFLRDSLLDFDYGFACHEIVWYKQGDVVRCRLALRPSSSIDVSDIHVRDGTIDHVIQRPPGGGELRIPGEKLVWFAHGQEGDSFAGRPILRPMYKAWKIKEELEIELPIAVRKGGIPDITTAGEPTREEAAALDEAARRFGLAPDAFIRHSDKVHVQLLTGNVSVDDILAAIAERNTELTSVCQAQVFDLGVSHAGSRALGTTLSDLFSNGIMAHARRREDVLNASGGLIHQLVAYNFPSDDNLPRLRFGNVQAVDLKSFAAALLAYSKASLPPELDEWARREMNMPERPVTQQVVPREPGPDSGAIEEGARAGEQPKPTALRLAEWREPRGVERYVALAEVDARFDDAKTAVREATQETRDKLIAELVRRASEAQRKGQLTRFVAGAAPMVDALADEIEDVLFEFFDSGAEQVAAELERQKRGEPVADSDAGAQDESARASEDTALAEPKKPTRKEAEAALREQAETAARAIAEETKVAAAVAAGRAAAGTPMTTEALKQAVTRASDEAALRFGLTVTADAMNLGRAVMAQERKYEIQRAIYSSILDQNRCEECEAMEGETTTDLDLAAGWTPHPQCAGQERCRCLVAYELDPEYREER